jgi:Spy/CpxP family protein refolding chaperone
MKRTALLLTLVAVIAVIGMGITEVEAQHMRGRGTPMGGAGMLRGGGMMMGNMMGFGAAFHYSPRWILEYEDELGLTESQEEALEDLEDSHEDAIDEISDKLDDVSDEFYDILDEDDIDLGAAESKIREMEKTRGDLHIERLKVSVEAKKILNDEQREEYEDLLEDHIGPDDNNRRGRMHGGWR